MKKFTYLISIGIAIILLSSIIPARIGNLWFNQYLSLIFFILLAGTFFIYGFNKSLSFLSLICLLSTYYVTRCSPRSMLLLFQLYMGAMATYGISFLDLKNRKIILKVILALAIIQFIWCIVQFFNQDPFFHSIYNQAKDNTVGFSGSPDQLGTFFALTAPLAISFNPTLALISIAGVYFSKSAFALIALIFPCLLFFNQFNKKIFKIALILILFFSIFYFLKVDRIKPADFKTRFSVWKHAISSTIKGEIDIHKNGQNINISTKSVYGFGFGNFLTIFPFVPQQNNFNYADEKFNHAHSDYIELFFELGWIGLLAISLLVLSFIKSFIEFAQDKELAVYFYSILAYLLNSMGNFLSQIAVSGTLLIIFYGMYLGKLRELKNGKLSILVAN